MKILLLLLALTGMNSMAGQANDVAYYRALVQNIETEAQKIRIKDEAGFIDAYFFLGKKEPYIGFQKEMAASSEFILTHLDEIAPNEYQKAIIAMSTWEMTRATFVTFLNSMADAVEAGKLDRKFFRWAQNPTEGHLSGLLAREYAKPDVQSIILRSRKIFEDQAGLVAQYDSMLAGESRRKLEQFEAAMRGGLSPASSQTQGPNIKKPVTQDSTGMSTVADTQQASASVARRAEEVLVKVTSTDEVQPKGREHAIRWSAVVGIMSVLACVGIWLLRKSG